MMRSTPNEFTNRGRWDYMNNKESIQQYWKEGAERSKNYESLYTLGMRGFGDCKSVVTVIYLNNPFTRTCPVPLSEDTNIQLLEGVIADQAEILKEVYDTDDVSSIPQVWTLCESFTQWLVHTTR